MITVTDVPLVMDENPPLNPWTLRGAAKQGRLKTVRFLAMFGDHYRGQGMTALMWAAQAGYTEIVRALLPISNPHQLDAWSYWSALLYAVNAGHTDVVKLLAPVSDMGPMLHSPLKWTPLIFAVTSGHMGTVRALLPLSDPAYKDTWGMTALDYARTGLESPKGPSPALLQVFLDHEAASLKSVAQEAVVPRGRESVVRPRL